MTALRSPRRSTNDIYELRSVGMSDFGKSVHIELDDVEKMLLAKNKAYGNSALEPCRVFSKAGVKEQLLVRIDDKLSRIRNMGFGDNAEDTVKD